MSGRVLLIMGLSVGIFLISAVVMYGAWVLLEGVSAISPLARGIISLFSYIFAFAASTYLFWKAARKMTITEVARA